MLFSSKVPYASNSWYSQVQWNTCHIALCLKKLTAFILRETKNCVKLINCTALAFSQYTFKIRFYSILSVVNLFSFQLYHPKQFIRNMEINLNSSIRETNLKANLFKPNRIVILLTLQVSFKQNQIGNFNTSKYHYMLIDYCMSVDDIWQIRNCSGPFQLYSVLL